MPKEVVVENLITKDLLMHTVYGRSSELGVIQRLSHAIEHM